MNSKNSKTSDLHRLLLNLTDKINLKGKDKYVALSNLSIYYIFKNVNNTYKNNKFRISSLTWNDPFHLPDGSSPVLDIQDYFEYYLRKHGENTDKVNSIRIFFFFFYCKSVFYA